jgi:uncharacterized protein (DUF924 family)
MNTKSIHQPGPVLEFWFGTPDISVAGAPRWDPAWFQSSDAYDDQVRSALGRQSRAAAAGELDDWLATPSGGVALVLLLDQAPRNIFRGSPIAYQSDAQALEVARHIVDRGEDERLHPLARLFLYLPFEHSERLEDQEQSVRLFAGMPVYPRSDRWLTVAERHREIVQRFGRFPHRNASLGRSSTSSELSFVLETSSFF